MPYRAARECDAWDNIMRARTVGRRILELGAVPLVPHLNTFMLGGVVPDDQILDATCELLTRCDGAVVGHNYGPSAGCQRELGVIEERAIPYIKIVGETLIQGQPSDRLLQQFILYLRGMAERPWLWPFVRHGPSKVPAS
jgi:hypothetical protein